MESQGLAGDCSPNADFAAFVRQHADALARFVRGRMSCPADVEDICADVFCVAFRGFAELAVLSPLQARRWLLRAAQLHCFHRYRADERARAAYRRAAREVCANSADPDEILEQMVDADAQRVNEQRVHQALRMLPSAVASVLVMDAFLGLSGPQIATVLQISPGAVRLRLMRARRSFATAYFALDESDREPLLDGDS